MRLRALQVSNSDLDTANVLQVVGLVFLFFPFFFSFSLFYLGPGGLPIHANTPYRKSSQARINHGNRLDNGHDATQVLS